jgi:hypothetical protein
MYNFTKIAVSVLTASAYLMVFGRASIITYNSPESLSMDAQESWGVTQIGDELQISYGSGTNFFQYGVLHLDSGYFRLNYGAESGWGTSIVLLPAFWSDGHYYQGAPLVSTWTIEGPNLALSVSGEIGGLNISSQIVISPPTSRSISAQVTSIVNGNIMLDDRPGEAFKPVFLSSMHISSAIWDTQAAYAGCHSIPIPGSSWIIPPDPPVLAYSFGLLGGTSNWKINAPTIDILLDTPMQLVGWVTPSADPNDDNVGFWAATDKVLPSWSYRIIASSAISLQCTFLPLAIKN